MKYCLNLFCLALLVMFGHCAAARGQQIYSELTADLTWGTNGAADLRVTDIASNVPTQAWTQTDGKLLLRVAGVESSRLVRFLANGELDRAYGQNGEVQIPRNWYVQSTLDRSNGLLFRSYLEGERGRIRRLDATGNVDSKWGSGRGFLDIQSEGVNKSSELFLASPDGGWLTAYGDSAARSFRIVRLTSQGELDTTFGIDGNRVLPRPARLLENQVPSVVTNVPDGSIVLQWNLRSIDYQRVAMTRIDPRGNLDITFGIEGVIQSTDLTASLGDGRIRIVNATPDSKLLVSGYLYRGESVPSIQGTWRIANGKIDTSFGVSAGFIGYTGEPVADATIDYACAASTWYSETLQIVQENQYSEAVSPPVRLSLCKNGRKIGSPVLLPPGENLTKPNYIQLTFSLESLPDAAGNLFFVAAIDGRTVCGRFNCTLLGSDVYVAKIDANGALVGALGQGRGFTRWSTAQPTFSIESVYDLGVAPDGTVIVSGNSRQAREIGASQYGAFSFSGFSKNGRPDGRLGTTGKLTAQGICCAGSGLSGLQTNSLGSHFWYGDGIGLALAAPKATLLSALPAAAGAPWIEDNPSYAPRADGTTWVRRNAFFNEIRADGTPVTHFSKTVSRIDGAGNALTNSVNGQTVVLFPEDNSGPNAIATFPDDGLLLINVNRGSAVVRLNRWDKDGKFDPRFGANGQLNVVLASGAATDFDFERISGFVLPNGDIWLAVNYSTHGGGQGALVHVNAATQSITVFNQGGYVYSPQTRADGLIAFRKAGLYGPTNEIVSIDLAGKTSSVFPPVSSWVAYAFQPDGRLLLATNDTVYRYNSTIRPTPAPPSVTVSEFYNSILDHFFITANEGEKQLIDSGGAGAGWARTKVEFKAWDRLWANAGATGATPAKPVYRFYGTPGIGPNSHFYTVVEGENQIVRRDPGWKFEEVSFYALEPRADKTCPDASTPVYRLYNNRANQNDSNHRYVLTGDIEAQMTARGWILEGITLCVGPVR
jgi:uncharacterized delta-60 repeat protein